MNNPLYQFTSLVIISSMLLLASASCKSNPTGVQTNEHVSSPSGTEQPTLTFGLIYPMLHPFYETITDDAEAASRANGAKLIVNAPDEANLEQQIRMMDNMIRQNVDGIAIAPVDAMMLAPTIQKAMNAGIPVICFESDSPESGRLTYIGTDNYASGVLMGETIGKLLNNRGMIVVQTGMAKMSSLQQRLEGLLTYLNEETDIDVLEVRYNEGSESTALAELEQTIDDHPHFDAFVALDFISGATSVLVWKASGLSRYALTFGMMPDLEEALRNGQLTSAISLNEDTWGELIVERLLQAHRGEAVPDYEDTGTTLIHSDHFE